MNQQTIGIFLKELRGEKELTQEQLAEQLGVSRRTISRWETGSNMPDLSILIELADFYEVDLREILDGERKSEKMNKELKETVHKVADYSNAQEQKLKKRMHILFLIGLVSFLIYMVMIFLDVNDQSFAYGAFSEFLLGVSLGIMIIGVIMTSKYSSKIRAFKMRVLQRVKPQA